MCQYIIVDSRTIDDNETGITYEVIFGDYLEGSTEIEIREPYVRQEYQFDNVKRLIEMFCRQENSEVRFELIIMESKGRYNDVSANVQLAKLDEIKHALSSQGINIDYRFDNKSKKRRITGNDRKAIQSDRGIHFYKPPRNKAEPQNFADRRCMQTEINYLKPLFPEIIKAQTVDSTDYMMIIVDNITETDVTKRNIRILKRNKFLFPEEIVGVYRKYSLTFNYREDQYDANYSIGSADGCSRSGVLKLNRDLFEEIGITVGTRLSIKREEDGTYSIHKI